MAKISPVDQPEDAIAMLQADHQRTKDLFQQYEQSRDPQGRQQLIAQVLPALELRMLLEDTVFYPALAADADEAGDELIDAAFQDHQRVRELMGALQACDPEDVEFDPLFHELMEAVLAQMGQEERELFPQAQAHLAETMESLTAEMQEIRQAILASS
jgi:hemerythrin superfamily protein